MLYTFRVVTRGVCHYGALVGVWLAPVVPSDEGVAPDVLRMGVHVPSWRCVTYLPVTLPTRVPSTRRNSPSSQRVLD